MSGPRQRWSRHTAPGALAQYVPSGVRVSGMPSPGAGEPWHRARQVFETLVSAGVRYGDEPTTSEPGRQVIRAAGEVLGGPRHGTCLDLAVLCAGLCLDAGLHPVVAVLDPVRVGDPGHAVVLIWLGGGWVGRPAVGYPYEGHEHGAWPALPAAPIVPIDRELLVRSGADRPGDWVAVDVSVAANGYQGRPAVPADTAACHSAAVPAATAGRPW